MSYSGYAQFWCPAGHYWEGKDYFQRGQTDEGLACPDCGAPPAFENDVDTTDCDSCGRIQPEPVAEAKHAVCNLGHVHVVRAAVFRIPGQSKDQ